MIGNPEGSWDKFKSPVPMNCCDCPVAVPTLTFGAERLTLTMGASAEKEISVAPESTMPVACAFWLLCTIYFRVGLKIELCCDILLLELLKLRLIMIPVPHYHNALLQPGVRLSLFFSSS